MTLFGGVGDSREQLKYDQFKSWLALPQNLRPFQSGLFDDVPDKDITIQGAKEPKTNQNVKRHTSSSTAFTILISVRGQSSKYYRTRTVSGTEVNMTPMSGKRGAEGH